MKKNKSAILALLYFLIPLLIYAQASDALSIEPEPGIYNQNIIIRLNTESVEDVLYGFDNGEETEFLPFPGGVILSALPGEERDYRIVLNYDNKTLTFDYKIDRKVPGKPEIRVENDFETGQKKIYFKSEAGCETFYGFDNIKNPDPVKVEGDYVTASDSTIVYAFTLDSAGNSSDYSIFKIDEDTIRRKVNLIDIKSPVEGEFANTQLLFIDKTGFDWIKYTLNMNDPVEDGIEYYMPVEIRRYGNITLKVAGKLQGSEKILYDEVNYRVTTRAPLKNIPESGIYSSAIRILNEFETYKYCIEERSPDEKDLDFNHELLLNPVAGGVKYSTLRLRNVNDAEQSEFRYFYIFDDRKPANPIIQLNQNLPFSNKVEVSMFGPDYSNIYYTLDGSNPGSGSTEYTKPFTLSAPENRNAGSFILKSRTISLNGKSSRIISNIITYDSQKPEIPVIDIIHDEQSNTYKLLAETEPGAQLKYRISSKNDLSEISYDPAVPSDFILDVPEGYESDFYIQFIQIDEAGNRSDETEVYKIHADRKPPAKPELLIADDIITIDAETAETFYSFEVYREGLLISKDSARYEGPFNVPDLPGNNSVLKFNIESFDSFGNKSELSYLYIPETSIIPGEPLFSRNETNQNIYSGDYVEFKVFPQNLNDELYYYLTLTDEEGKTATSGPVKTANNIRIEGEPNTLLEYYLEVFSKNKNTGKTSDFKTFSFVIDNKSPEIPELIGIKNGMTVNYQVMLNPLIDDNSTVFMSFREGQEIPDSPFDENSFIFNKPVVFDVDAGGEKTFNIVIGAEDAAGNRSINDELFSFTIDKKVPDNSSILTESIYDFTDSFVISAYNPDGSRKYYYEITESPEIPVEPGIGSKFFTDNLIVNGEPGIEKNLYVKIKTADSAGNLSSNTKFLSFNIDQKKPLNDISPFIEFNRSKSRILLGWNNGTDSLKFRIPELSAEFTDFIYPKTFKFDKDLESIHIEYLKTDSGGNSSDIRSQNIFLPFNNEGVIVNGIENNASYNSDVNARRAVDGAFIRYEISTEDFNVPEVTVFSPEMPDKLIFSAADGETINYSVKFKEFQNKDDITGGKQQTVRFSIDKKSPLPPGLSGIVDGEYYLDDQTVSFESNERKIFYSITDINSSSEEFSLFTKPIRIASESGTYATYMIMAFSEDSAGNRSNTAVWSITIDKEIIYVSPDGKDYASGTRSNPFKTLNRAVEQLKNSDRKTIFLAEGKYTLNSSVIIDENISIYGGFKSNNWFEQKGTSLIETGDVFIGSNPLFYVYGGTLNLRKIRTENIEQLTDSVFFLNKGTLNFTDCEFKTTSVKLSSFIRQFYGEVNIINSSITAPAQKDSIIDSSDGLLKIVNSSISGGSDSNNFDIIKINNTGNFVLSSSKITAESGKNLNCIKSYSSFINLRSAEFNILSSDVSASVINAENSNLTATYIKVKSQPEVRLFNIVEAVDSSIELIASTIVTDAGNSIVGFKLTGGQSKFNRNTLKTGNSVSDFVYLFNLNQGRHRFETNIFDIGDTDNVLAFKNIESEIEVFNNTFVLNSFDAEILFDESVNSNIKYINNIFDIEQPESSGIFINNFSDNHFSIKNNCFNGWSVFTSGLNPAVNLIELDLLDGSFSSGNISGNISTDIIFNEDGKYRLNPESPCIDSGYNLENLLNNKTDIDGESRPNRVLGLNPVYDIGADEYYDY